MTTEKTFFFDDKFDLVAYLKNKNPEIGPIRLQKTLYFLYAFYGATYGKINENTESGISEVIENSTYPRRLFDVEFEAWQYGPVVRDVYFANRDNPFKESTYSIEGKYQSTTEKDILKFIDNLVDDLQEMSDFALVDRTHQDKVWQEAFDRESPYASKVIDNDDLVEEYKTKLDEASAI